MQGWVLGVLLVGAVGCSGADFQVADDSGAAADSTADTSGRDTSGGDTSIGDTGAGDTSSDTQPRLDTGVGIDTGVGLDTGLDGGPACPRPVSTAPPLDVSTMGCDAIQAKYVPYVSDAKACRCDADCSKIVARDLCGCGTNVSPANDAYPSLEPLRKRFSDLACIIICPKIPCLEPPTPKCIFDTGATLGKCN